MGLPFYIILYQPRKRPDCSDEQPRRFNLIKKIYYHNDPFLFADYFEFIKLPFYIILYQPRKRPDCSDEQPRRFNLIKKIYYHNDPFLFADYFEFIKQ